MIKNERQYRITKAQADKFSQALQQFDNEPINHHIHPLLQRAQREALVSQLEELNSEIAEYDALRSGSYKVLELTSFDEFPRALIQSRIAIGLSQKELADKLGLKEQQIQRYEATDYASASLERIKQIVNVLGIIVREDVFLPSAQIKIEKLFKKLTEIGLNKNLILKKFLPRSIANELENIKIGEENESLALRAATTLSRILKCQVGAFFTDTPLVLSKSATGGVRFKVGAGANERRLSAYSLYAIYLAHLILDATADLPQKPIPVDYKEFRKEVLDAFGSINFENVLKYYWSIGVPILPLGDSGAFHGACIRENGRNVIILKQQILTSARWLHDLLHEGYHSGQEPEMNEREIIEESEMSEERRNSEEEQLAGKFAGDVMLDGRTDELIKKCILAAGSKIERLKFVVPQIAKQEGIQVDVLANYMAYSMSLFGKNWWGVAANLQNQNENPWKIARDVCLSYINLGSLNEIDQNLLMQAMSDEE